MKASGQNPAGVVSSDTPATHPITFRAALEQALLAAWFPPANHTGTPFLQRILLLLAHVPAGLTGWVARRSRQRIQAKKSQSFRRTGPSARPRIIVVGNLVVGGAGKTPLTIALARRLHQDGHRVGVLCNAYRAGLGSAAMVNADADADRVGDEALVLALETGVPVCAGPQRAEALALLCGTHPLDVVVSDDGLQHAALPRDLELAVFDARGAGNGQLLPAGPLREPLSHLDQMDALMMNDSAQAPRAHPATFQFDVRATGFTPLAAWRTAASDQPVAPASPLTLPTTLRSGRVVALTSMAQPERLATTLQRLGLDVTVHALGDHARIDRDRIARLRADAIILTSKDAVKLQAVDDPRCWVLQVQACPAEPFWVWLYRRLADTES